MEVVSRGETRLDISCVALRACLEHVIGDVLEVFLIGDVSDNLPVHFNEVHEICEMKSLFDIFNSVVRCIKSLFSYDVEKSGWLY